MTRRHHQTRSSIAPDPYERGQEGRVTLKLNLNRHDSRWINNYDYRVEPPLGNGNKIELYQYLDTIGAGEYIITRNAVAFDYGRGNNIDPPYLANRRIQQNEVDNITGVANTDILKFISRFGGYGYAWEEGIRYWNNREYWDMWKPNPKEDDGGHMQQLIDPNTATKTIGGNELILRFPNLTPKLMSKMLDRISLQMGGDCDAEISLTNSDYETKSFSMKAGTNEIPLEFKVTKSNQELRIVLKNNVKLLWDNSSGGAGAGELGIWYLKVNGGTDYAQVHDLCMGVVVNDYQEEIVDQGWDMIDNDVLLQLIGQAPHVDQNLFNAVKGFFWIDEKSANDKMPIDKDIFSANISGANWFPMGAKQNGGGAAYALGMAIIMHLKGNKRFNIILGGVGGFPAQSLVFNDDTGAHGATVYYAKPLTDKELGYKFYIDTAGDRVLMLDYQASATGFAEMPKGLERGIALRYTNRQHRKVLRKYSEIQAEAEKIMSEIKMV